MSYQFASDSGVEEWAVIWAAVGGSGSGSGMGFGSTTAHNHPVKKEGLELQCASRGSEVAVSRLPCLAAANPTLSE